MPLNKVKKSLHKFLSDNLDVFVTYDSNESELININDISTDVDVLAGTLTFKLVETELGVAYKTDSDIVGKKLRLIDSDEYVTIDAWDNTLSLVTVDVGFSTDIIAGDQMSIISESLIFMDVAHSNPNASTKDCFTEDLTRFYLYVKVKNDSNKDKIYDILQDIRNIIRSNRSNIIIYDNDLITEIGYLKIKSNTYAEDPVIDTEKDLQSFRVGFVGGYFVKYV